MPAGGAPARDGRGALDLAITCALLGHAAWLAYALDMGLVASFGEELLLPLPVLLLVSAGGFLAVVVGLLALPAAIGRSGPRQRGGLADVAASLLVGVLVADLLHWGADAAHVDLGGWALLGLLVAVPLAIYLPLALVRPRAARRQR